MSEPQFDPELSAFADGLARLKPRPAALERDTLMFRAGQAAAPRGWKWPSATIASTCVALGLGVAILFRPPPPVVVQTVTVTVRESAPVASTPEPKPVTPPLEPAALVTHELEAPPLSDYQRLQDHLLRWGFDGLPPVPRTAPLPKETRASLLRSL